MTGNLALTFLGKPQITRAGAPVHLLYNKAMALLAHLAVHPRAHSRDAMAALLWSDLTEASAHANLRKILAVLRQVMGDELEITRQTVAIAPTGERQIDIELFQSKLLSLRSTTLEPASLTEQEVGLLAEAAALYRGDFLEGFNVRDAPAFEEWVLPQRERLRQMVLHALYTLTAYFTARGLYAQGIESATRLLTLEPWHEEVHRQMMLLLSLNGQRSAALEQYELCRRVLKAELGVEPTPDTIALYRRIAAGDVAPLPTPAQVLAQVATPARRPPHNLPEHLTLFTGRRTELDLLGERLSSPECRLITITGVSGVGKTRLALQAACDVMAGFRDGVFYIQAGEIDCAGALVPAVLEALKGTNGARLEDTADADPCADDRLAGLATHLKDSEILLILDGFEHLLEAGPLLCDLLRRLPGLKLLLTSIRRLDLVSEAILPLGGLSWDLADRVASAAAHRDPLPPAVQLFDRAAQRTRLDFNLVDSEVKDAARICKLVGGLPLGIEIAAGWVGVLSCADIAAEIERSLDFLTAPARDRLAHHVSLRAALNYSWSRLSAEEREIFMRLSVLPAGFTREAAAEVAGANLRTLAALADHGLLRSTPFGRYELHSFTAQYAAEMLSQAPPRLAETERRYQEYERAQAPAAEPEPVKGWPWMDAC